MDLNHRPKPYKSSALTNWATGTNLSVFIIKTEMFKKIKGENVIKTAPKSGAVSLVDDTGFEPVTFTMST